MRADFELVEKFQHLFDGNRTAVGTEEGGCRRTQDGEWELELEGHLRMPDCAIGVYPMEAMNDDDITSLGTRSGPLTWVVKWGCVDFDEGDEESWIHAQNVRQTLDMLGVISYVERSRSKGYHVWVFADDWVPAATMREALFAACQIVGAPTKEINPKQVSLKPNQLGNYVRLPYPGDLGDDEAVASLWYGWCTLGIPPRRVMVNPDGDPWTVEQFMSLVKTNPRADLELAASYYLPNEPRQLIERDWSQLNGPAIDRLRGKARIIFNDGPLEHPDSPTNYRGHTLWKLVSTIAEDGQHTPEEALELLIDADERWGKFAGRPDGRLRLQQMVERAFSE